VGEVGLGLKLVLLLVTYRPIVSRRRHGTERGGFTRSASPSLSRRFSWVCQKVEPRRRGRAWLSPERLGLSSIGGPVPAKLRAHRRCAEFSGAIAAPLKMNIQRRRRKGEYPARSAERDAGDG
jgi:hypothetical protein